MDFKNLKWVLSPAVIENGQTIKPEAAILYGNFIQNVIDFLIIAFSIFFVIYMIGKAKDKFAKPFVEEVKEEVPAPPTQEELLTEIRDLLKQKAE